MLHSYFNMYIMNVTKWDSCNNKLHCSQCTPKREIVYMIYLVRVSVNYLLTKASNYKQVHNLMNVGKPMRIQPSINTREQFQERNPVSVKNVENPMSVKNVENLFLEIQTSIISRELT